MSVDFTDRWLNLFVPLAMLIDPDARRSGWMFTASHGFGRLIGFAVLPYHRLDPGRQDLGAHAALNKPIIAPQLLQIAERVLNRRPAIVLA